jgi:diacylglycerol kinase (CTP)
MGGKTPRKRASSRTTRASADVATPGRASPRKKTKVGSASPRSARKSVSLSRKSSEEDPNDWRVMEEYVGYSVILVAAITVYVYTKNAGYNVGDVIGFVQGGLDGYNSQISSEQLFTILMSIQGLGCLWVLFVAAKGHGGVKNFVREMGVRLRRVKNVALEIERKSFHLSGVVPPMVWMYTTKMGWPRSTQTKIAWGVTAFGWSCDIARVYIPFVQRNWPLKKILREHEYGRLCGACYMSLGVTTSLTCFPPEVAVAAICFLVLGDLTAALIGRSFGGDLFATKVGRQGNKSVEGSLAMFCMCVLIGLIIFKDTALCEYAVVLGAFVATMTELWEPFGLNDNLTIPVFSALSLHYGLLRVGALCNVAASV